MSDTKGTLRERHLRIIMASAGLVGIAAVGTIFAVAAQKAPATVEQPIEAATPAEEAVEAVATPEAIPMELPETSAAEAAAQAAAAAAGVDLGPAHVFAAYSAELQQGYWMDSDGQCYGSFGKSPMDMALDVEGKVGKRISGVAWFEGGMFVVFRNGDKLAVWPTLIDCKDPPRDPYAQPEPQAGSGRGT